MILHYHSMIERSTVNGPGARLVIWFQGCTLGCPHCWNPETHSTTGGRSWDANEIAVYICATAKIKKLDGLTVSGGEPMQQPEALLELLRQCHTRIPNLSIGLFSGYSERELKAMPIWDLIRAHLDFAVMGRFNKLQPSTEPLVTSKNQVLHIYQRYTQEDFGPQAIEIEISGSGLVQLTGFPVRGF